MGSNWSLKEVKPGYEKRLNIYFSSKKEKELALEFVEEAKIEEVLP
jgi:hypothetical protein